MVELPAVKKTFRNKLQKILSPKLTQMNSPRSDEYLTLILLLIPLRSFRRGHFPLDSIAKQNAVLAYLPHYRHKDSISEFALVR